MGGGARIPDDVTPHWLARYPLALGIVGSATLLRAAADPVIHDQIPYFIYVASVVVATWFCGVGGGVFSTLLAAFVGNYLFVPPRYEPVPHGEDWNAMGMFAAVSLGLVWLVGRWRRAERELRSQADALRILNAEAERSNRLKDEFLATLSHELRTPLNAIVGWARLLDTAQLDPEQQKRATDAIVRNANAQARLVEDILDVSAIVAARFRLNLAAVDLAAVVQSAVDMIRPAAEAKGIEIRTTFAAQPVSLGDADRLRQVAWNLVSNAVKFSDRGTVVNVAIDAEDSKLRLTVSDAGRGIDPAFLPHLFERFRQADSSTTREHGGLGLGLAIVRHITELHGGTVTAESAGVDRGATFTATFPIRTAAEPAQASPLDYGPPADVSQARDVSLDGVRVLVVDDEPDTRDLVATVLGSVGAHVRTAASASEALDLLQGWRPHVLLSDIAMPGEDGYELIGKIRRLAPENGGTIPAAALTAYADAKDGKRTLEAGFDRHVSKPIAPAALAQAVRDLADQGRQRRS